MSREEETRQQRLTSESTLMAYLELLRLPNVFTAMADVAMGFLFVQACSWTIEPRDGWVLAALVVASSMLYGCGVVLNDVSDLEHDTRHRPGRPLPSGRVSLKAARWLGWQLLAIGVILGCVAGASGGNFRPGMAAALLAAAIVLYNMLAKQTPIGPVVMGLCRALNVLLGMSVLAAPLAAEHWLVAGGIGVYTAGVTWFARNEAGRPSRGQLAAATLIIVLGIVLLAQFPRYSERIVELLAQQPQRWILLMTILGLLIGWRCLRAAIDPHPQRIRAAVTHCIMSLVLLDAAACYAVRGLFWAVMILMLLVPAMVFGKWIDST